MLLLLLTMSETLLLVMRVRPFSFSLLAWTLMREVLVNAGLTLLFQVRSEVPDAIPKHFARAGNRLA